MKLYIFCWSSWTCSCFSLFSPLLLLRSPTNKGKDLLLEREGEGSEEMCWILLLPWLNKHMHISWNFAKICLFCYLIFFWNCDDTLTTDASFKKSLPGQVRAPAVFRCHRVTAISSGEGELAYQATVNIGGHVFKGFLYDQGIDDKNGFPSVSHLHLESGNHHHKE